MVRLIKEDNRRVYTVKEDYEYGDYEDNLWDLLDGFGYDVEEEEDFEKYRQKFEEAGWLPGTGEIIIPKGTKFTLGGSDNYYDYITIQGGPLSGMNIGFLNSNDYEDYDDEDYDDDEDYYDKELDPLSRDNLLSHCS